MKRNLIFNDYVKVGKDIWFSASNYNGLYKYDIEKKRAEWVGCFSNEGKTKKWLFKSVKLWKDKLVFIPNYADAVHIYDIKRKCFNSIDILNETVLEKYRNINKFECGGIYENKIYIIGCGYPGVIKINLETDEVSELNVFPKRMLKESNKGSFFGCTAVTEKDYLYFTCCSSNEVIMLNMKTEEIDIKKVGNESDRYRSVFKGDNGYYLVKYDNDSILYWNKDDNSTMEIDVKFDKHYWGRGLCETKRFLWIMSLVSNEICRVDKKGNTLVKICYDNQLHIEDFIVSYNDKVVFVDSASGKWFEIQEDGQVVDMQFSIIEPRDEKDVFRVLGEDVRFSVQRPIVENEYINLKNYLFFLSNTGKQFDSQKRHLPKGAEINKYLISTLFK